MPVSPLIDKHHDDLVALVLSVTAQDPFQGSQFVGIARRVLARYSDDGTESHGFEGSPRRHVWLLGCGGWRLYGS